MDPGFLRDDEDRKEAGRDAAAKPIAGPVALG
jgi:hypothetical protein